MDIKKTAAAQLWQSFGVMEDEPTNYVVFKN